MENRTELADVQHGHRDDLQDQRLNTQRDIAGQRLKAQRDLAAIRSAARAAPKAAAARAPTKSGVIGRLLDKQSRGQPLSAAESQVLSEHGSSRPKDTYLDGTVIEMPDGSTKVRKNGKWVAE
jgi:hypothetical protein